MSEVSLYKLNLTAADFDYNTLPGPSWRSSVWGGTGTPNSDYPEFGEMENVRRNEGTGASGQNVIDAADTSQYVFAWITLCGVGNLGDGQFDARGGGPGRPLKCRWKQFLKSSALAEVGYCSSLVLANGGTGGTGSGLFASNRFFQLEMLRTSGATFNWNAIYLTPSGTTFDLVDQLGSSDTADDAEHTIIATITPSTVTGAYSGTGFLGSAVVASDGSFDVTVDGVSVVSASGLQFVINRYASNNPGVYFGKTIWHGD